jgi:hypothetical protein
MALLSSLLLSLALCALCLHAVKIKVDPTYRVFIDDDMR